MAEKQSLTTPNWPIIISDQMKREVFSPETFGNQAPTQGESAMSDELNRLIELARKVDMSEEDKERQRISFAYGNTRIENDDITWDTVKKAAEDLKHR